MKPITPDEAFAQYPDRNQVSDQMIIVINELLKRKYDGVSCAITHEDIRNEWLTHEDFPNIRDQPWVDFKPTFIKGGWDIEWIKESNYLEDGYDRWEFKRLK